MKRILIAILLVCLLAPLAGCAKGTQPTDYTTLDSLAGKRIGVETGSIFDEIALARWPDAAVLYFEGTSGLVVALQQDKVDAFITDEPVARDVARNTPGFRLLSESLMPDEYGFAFQKNEAGKVLRDAFTAYMLTAEDGKLLEDLDAIWFGEDESKKVVEPASALPATNGIVRFASMMQQPPFNYVKDGQPVGFEIDLITRFCKDKGYGLTIETVPFAALIPGLVSNRYDAVASSMSITAERAESVYFSDPSYYGGVVAVVSDATAAADAVPVETARIGAVTGTTCEVYCLEHYPDAEYASFSLTADLFLALKNGKLDYAVTDMLDAINHIRNDSAYRIVRDDLRHFDLAIALPKGSEQLLSQLSALLDQYEADGTLERLEANWIRTDGSDYVIDPVPEHADGEELRVAICAGFEPGCFMMDGEYAGYDIELIQRLAYDLGRRAVFMNTDFPALIAAIESGRADVAISSMEPTAERAERVNFTRRYRQDSTVLVRHEAEGEQKEGFFASLSQSFYRNFIVESRWKLIVSGIGVTLLLSICSGLAGIVIGFGFCLMRMSRYRTLDSTATVITRVLQGTPMVVLLMILYYVVFNKTGLDGISVSIIAFGLNFGAYASEIMLSGIRAVDIGQREAAAAIGFSSRQTFLKIVFPQAAKHFLPVLKGEYISLVKMTAIVGYVAVQDLTKMSDIIRSRTYEAFFPLIVTAIIYFLLSFGLSSLLRLVEIRIDPKRRPRTLKGVELS